MTDIYLELYIDPYELDKMETNQEFKAWYPEVKGKESIKIFIPMKAIKNKDKMGCVISERSSWTIGENEYLKGLWMGAICGLLIGFFSHIF